MQSLGKEKLRNYSASFTIKDGRIISPAATLSGNMGEIKAQGSCALTGEMDLKRVRLLLPKMQRYAGKKGVYLEVLSHPGRSLPSELTEEYGPDDRKAFVSPGRDTEYTMLMNI